MTSVKFWFCMYYYHKCMLIWLNCWSSRNGSETVFIRHCWISGTKINSNKKQSCLYFQLAWVPIRPLSLIFKARNSVIHFFCFKNSPLLPDPNIGGTILCKGSGDSEKGNYSLNQSINTVTIQKLYSYWGKCMHQADHSNKVLQIFLQTQKTKSI